MKGLGSFGGEGIGIGTGSECGVHGGRVFGRGHASEGRHKGEVIHDLVRGFIFRGALALIRDGKAVDGGALDDTCPVHGFHAPLMGLRLVEHISEGRGFHGKGGDVGRSGLDGFAHGMWM